MKFKPHRQSATEAQRERILQALRAGPKNTEQLRQLGIFQTSTRILELRRRDYDIRTELVNLYDREGFPHARAALYYLEAEPPPGNDKAPTVAAVQGLLGTVKRSPDCATPLTGQPAPREVLP